jgi:hypothetical protein
MTRLLPFLTGLLLSLLLAASATAEPLSDARGGFRQADQSLVAATARQARLRSAHESLMSQIRVRKADPQARLPGVGDGTLDALLKQANDLSGQLEAADREIARTRQQVAARRAALVSAFDRALGVANAQVAQRTGEARRTAFQYMQSLIAERAQLLAATRRSARGQQGTVRLPAVADGASAEELRELADEASDNVERVRTQLEALESRLSALSTRRTLLRASLAMDGDLALFGEDERNRRIARADRPTVASATDGATGRADPTERAGDGSGGEIAGGGGLGNEPPPAAVDPSPQPEQGDSDGDGLVDGTDDFGAIDPPAVDVAPGVGVAVDAIGGAVVFEAALDPLLLSADLEALSPGALADQLAALRKKRAALRKAADALAKRRTALEARAATLEQQ